MVIGYMHTQVMYWILNVFDLILDESDMIDAFVACGGLQDKTGNVKRDTLVKIIKHDFGLTIDIEELINKIDTDGSGEIEFEEFKTLLS